MMFRRTLHLPLACLLVLGVLTNPFSAYGYVWCLGTDGHAVLETAVAGDCDVDCGAPSAAGTSVLCAAADADGCGPCLDITSSHQWGAPRTADGGRPLALPAVLPQAAAVAIHTSARQPITNGLAAEPAPRTPEPILLHRTTVLLI